MDITFKDDQTLQKMVFRKTSAGYTELQGSSKTLPLRTRTALVMVDGKTAIEALVARLAGLDINLQTFERLLAMDLIEPLSAKGAAARRAAEASTATVVVSEEAVPSAERIDVDDSRGDDAARRRELYALFTQTIRDLLGLRGYLLQLAVEKASTLEEFQAVRERYLKAVSKARGETIADAMRIRIDDILR